MTHVVRNLFQIRSQSFFYHNIVSLEVLPSIWEALHKYDLFSYCDSWFPSSVFPSYASWEATVKSKIEVFEEMHPSLDFAKSCLELVPLQKFWAISVFTLT